MRKELSDFLDKKIEKVNEHTKKKKNVVKGIIGLMRENNDKFKKSYKFSVGEEVYKNAIEKDSLISQIYDYIEGQVRYLSIENNYPVEKFNEEISVGNKCLKNLGWIEIKPIGTFGKYKLSLTKEGQEIKEGYSNLFD